MLSLGKLQSDLVDKIFVAPGNAGTSLESKAENIEIVPLILILGNFSKEENIGLVIVGPEDPLVNGITDAFKKAGIKCFGPQSIGAQLEGSKDFAKAFMKKLITSQQPAIALLMQIMLRNIFRKNELPKVIKADGLAAGKGVVIAENYETAIKT